MKFIFEAHIFVGGRSFSNQRGQIMQPMKILNVGYAIVDDEKILLSFNVLQ